MLGDLQLILDLRPPEPELVEQSGSIGECLLSFEFDLLHLVHELVVVRLHYGNNACLLLYEVVLHFINVRIGLGHQFLVQPEI